MLLDIQVCGFHRLKSYVFLVNELKRFRMEVVCISEMKWFGSDVYEVDGYTLVVTCLGQVMCYNVVKELQRYLILL